jgi:hypothetical protein
MCCADVFPTRHLTPGAVEDEKADGGFNTEAARSAAGSEEIRDFRKRILIFMPDADPSAGRKQFARPRFLEGREHPGGVAALRDERREEALAAPPTDSGEIEQGRAGLEEEGSEAVGFHRLLEFANLLDSWHEATRKADRSTGFVW